MAKRKALNVMADIFQEEEKEAVKEAPQVNRGGAPRKAEKRSYNMTFAITPSLHERIKRIAEIRNTSANSMLNSIVTDFIIEMERKYNLD